MIQMYDLCEIVNIAANSTATETANATIQELKKHGMLISFKPTAFERTKHDIQNFKKALELLADEQVPNDFKKKVAMHSISMQRALKRLKEIVSDKDFILFYQSNFNGQTNRSLSVQYEIDEATVRRSINKCLKKLSIYLHPDLSINEILN